MEKQDLFEKILLVEDDPAHALIIKRALNNFCSNIEHKTTLREAESMIPDFNPDLIISDLHLPDSKGIQDVSSLVNSGIPLLVLTSSTAWKDAVDAMKYGAQDFIVKDFGENFVEAMRVALTRVSSAVQLLNEKKKLLRQMEALRVTIENSNDGLAIIDPNGIITYANKSFKNFVLKCGEETNQITSIFSDKVQKATELRESIKNHLTTLEVGTVWHSEVCIKDDATAYDFSLTALSKESTDAGWVVWVRDTTEIKRREKFQREMLSTTTHDLKGPLGAISLSAEVLENMTEKGSRVNDIALRIESSAQGAINLIEEFLSTRRMQESNFIMKPAEVFLEDVLSKVTINYQAIATARGIEFQVEDTKGISANIDSMGVERVLSNLLNNAFKFTSRGGKVGLKSGKNEDGGVWIEVSDTGTGMEPSEVTQIFQRFTRLERHNAIAGTGLGLSVVKSIVDAHGGNIEVTSKINHGTTFKLIFPSQPPVNEHGELIALDFV